jgi:GNAT superfamily N-acetyltransferase
MQRRLRRATLEGGYLRRFMVAFPTSLTVVLLSPGGQVIGWSFAHRHGNKPTDLNLFIDRRYRRKGFGTLLIKEALKDFRKIRLAEWDVATKRLFRKLHKQYPKRIVVFNWWKEFERYETLVAAAIKNQLTAKHHVGGFFNQNPSNIVHVYPCA